MFYKKLQQLCIEKGVTMKRVAADIGISPAAITKWSKGGKPNHTNIKALAKYFGTTIAAFSDDDSETSQFAEQFAPVAPAQNFADAYADLRKDYDDFRAIVQSQQNTIQTLSDTGNKLADSTQNLTISSIKWADSNKDLAASTKNLSISNKNLSDSIKHLATKGSLAKSRR